MNICLNFSFLNEIKSTDLLTYLTLILAYVAYTWSVNRDHKSWKSLFVSFKNDLASQRAWLGSEYFADTYRDKNSFNPYKIIFPLSFESLPEIIRRGIAEFSWIPKQFIDLLSLFNERIVAFNSLLDQIKKINSADPIKTEKVKEKLNELGLEDENIGFDELKRKIKEQKESEEILYLAENNRRLNKLVHVNLIGNGANDDKLYFLYSKIDRELDNILNIFDKKRPWFIKYKWLIIIISIILFYLIELL